MTHEDLMEIIGPLEQYKDPKHEDFEAKTSYLLWSAMPDLFTTAEAKALAKVWGKVETIERHYSQLKYTGPKHYPTKYVKTGRRSPKKANLVEIYSCDIEKDDEYFDSEEHQGRLTSFTE